MIASIGCQPQFRWRILARASHESYPALVAHFRERSRPKQQRELVRITVFCTSANRKGESS